MKDNKYPVVVGNLNTTYDYERIITEAANAKLDITQSCSTPETKNGGRFPDTTKVNTHSEGPRLTLKRTGTRHK